MMNRALAIATFGTLAACGSTEMRSGSDMEAGPEPADLPSIRSERIDTLSEAQAETLCREDAQRFDPCLALGVAARDEALCMEVLAACRAAGTSDTGFSVACGGYEFGPAGSCAITVDEYLTCVDVWDELLRCENAGKLIETPEACRGVVAKCPRLAVEFYQNGAPPPCGHETLTRPPRMEEDIYGFDGCRPIPARLVILGDSIAACFSVGAGECGPLLLGQHIQQTWSPDLIIESRAVSGAVMADLPAQATAVQGGPGHVLVWIYILGNDLVLRHIDEPAWSVAWTSTFEYFTDPARFPDGATFLLNTQYSPFDQCPEPLGGAPSISAEADQLLQDLNRRVFLHLAEQRSDTVAVDQYPDWLGHGNNANVRDCPHCGSDNASWMADGSHPNALGYAHMVDKWKVAIDRMYGSDCESSGVE